MEKHALVIVESPAKARTLQKVLGDEYRIAASVGHVRDLPAKEMGVDAEHDFKVTYTISPDKKKVIADLKKAVKAADEVYLATDPDREGEAISWHLMESLGIQVPIYRLVFHEVTPEAIRHAFDEPREIDMHLVKAQETRRILDRLVGYEISPILWRKVADLANSLAQGSTAPLRRAGAECSDPPGGGTGAGTAPLYPQRILGSGGGLRHGFG
jgi:DNA topoisomerase-1